MKEFQSEGKKNYKSCLDYLKHINLVFVPYYGYIRKEVLVARKLYEGALRLVSDDTQLTFEELLTKTSHSPFTMRI